MTTEKITELRSLLERGSADPGHYCELAEELAEISQNVEAVSVLRSCLALSLTTFQRARVTEELASLLFNMSRPAEAEELGEAVRSLLADEPDSPDVLMLRSLNESLTAQCVWITRPEAVRSAAQSALDSLEHLLTTGPAPEDLGVVYSEAAKVCSLLERPGQVIEFCRLAAQYELSPQERLSCLVCLAEALRLTGTSDKALAAVEEALSLTHPGDNAVPLLQLTRGLAFRDAGRRSQAWRSLYEALETLEAHPLLCHDLDMVQTFYAHLSHLAATGQDHEEAAVLLSRFLRKYSQGTVRRCRLVVWIGDCYALAGAPEKARGYYQQVLSSPEASDAEKDEARRGFSTLPPTQRRSH